MINNKENNKSSSKVETSQNTIETKNKETTRKLKSSNTKTINKIDDSNEFQVIHGTPNKQRLDSLKIIKTKSKR